MSIAVFYLRNFEPEGQTPVWLPQCRAFSDAQMSEALALCQQLRKDERHAHVVISSELRDMVGPVGLWACLRSRMARRPMEWTISGARPGVPEPVAEMRPSHPGSARIWTARPETAD